MEKIIDLIKQLNEKNSDWKKYLEDSFYFEKMQNDAYSDETKNLINLVLSEIKKIQIEMIEDDKAEISFWNYLIENGVPEGICKLIIKRNKTFVIRYQNFKPLRQAKENVVQLIIDIFDHVCTYYNPQFLLNNEAYSIDDSEAFIKAALQLDQMVSMQIGRHYDKQTAQADFINNTGLDEVYGLIYGELYEKNMLKIQNNLVLDRLDRLAMKVDELSSKIIE